jgi:hypothetical protein
MSYGMPAGSCFVHEIATNIAFGTGAVLVASGGNDFAIGNAPASPAVDPHILTVAAVDSALNSAFFSSENNAIDVSAPGVDILTTVPPGFDTDGTPDGYQQLDGTSFSAPIVAAAATWISQVRPSLANDQVAEVIRDSALDLGQPGWEQQYGFGLINLRGALNQRAQPHDPNETNDDIPWVNGTFFAADAPIFRPPNTSKTVSGRLDQLEDPADVYRVKVGAHTTIRFRMTVSYGDPDLEVFKSSAKTIYSTKGRLGSSTKSGRATDTVTWTNRSRRAAYVYVDAYITPGIRALDAGYRLEIKKLRTRR